MVMDPSKLDKMKVVELRAELTARGLDSKGVKAVLVDRLKAALEAGSGATGNVESEPSVPPPGTPVQPTPSRRGRRTRSMTRSPSPIKKAEPVLETLNEEPQTTNTQIQKEEVAPKDEIAEEPKIPETVISQQEEQSPAEHKITEEKAGEMKSPQKSPEKRVEAKRRSSESRRSDDKKSDDRKSEDRRSEERSKTDGNKAKPPEISTEVKEKKSPEKRPRRRESDPVEEPPAKIPAKENQAEEPSEKAEAPAAETEQAENIADTEPTVEKMEMDTGDKDENDQSTVTKMETEEKPEEKGRRRSRSGSRSASRSVSRSRSRSGSRSRSRTSRSRSRSRSESERKQGRRSPELNADDFTNEEDEPVMEDKQFGLSWFDSDLHLRIDPVTFNSAKPLTEDAFGLVWSGARTNFGVRDGKIVYEIRLSEELSCNPFRDEKHLKGFRCGVSLPKTGLLLGEFENSFAYCETGQKAVNGEFTDYGKPFALDDVIGCYLDLESTPCKVEFTLNGESQGVAFEFDKEIMGENDAMFPHVLTKGYEFQINFADNENLLVNVEKPKRHKKKTPSPSPQKKKESRSQESDNWESDSEKKEKAKKPEDSENKGEEEKKEEEPSGETEVLEDEKEITDVEAQETKSDDEKDEEEPRETEKENEERTEETIENEKNNTEEVKEAVDEPREPKVLLEGYELIGLLPEETLIQGPQRPESRKECEVFLLVGLPGSGKTHWANNQVKENPDKRYNVIGPDALIEKMKVNGKPRKEYHIGKWEKVYDLCCKSVGVLEEIATKRRRNYILDQPNVIASCQRRKMKGFGDFKRIAVVCIPSEDELKRRNDLKSEAQGISCIKENAINKLKANFTLPSIEFGWFDEVRYTDLEGDEAKDEVKKYNEKGKKAVQAAQSKYKRQRRDNYRRDDRRRRDERRRSDFRGPPRWKNDRNDRRGGNHRWGPPGGGRSGGWRDDRYGGGGGGYDRRDRYSSGGGGNWVHNNRQRYDDRFYGRPGSGGGGNRYDYGGGRDYRDRYDRDRNGSGGRRDSNRGGSQRDFRAGHRDNHSEDSRGGYERSSSKYSSDAYDYKSNRTGNTTSSKSSLQSTNGSANQNKWGSQQTTWGQPGQEQQAYWSYNQMQAYGTPSQQSQWPVNNADPRQQAQWMNWWQQQGSMANNQQYWTQYAQQAYPQTGTGHQDPLSAAQTQTRTMGMGSRSESKKP